MKFLDFKTHAKEVTRQIVAASKIEWAKEAGRFRYLGSSQIFKDEAARQILQAHPLEQGLAAVLQCVEPCWTFDVKSVADRLTIVGEPGKCSMLYHYFRHPLFGWMELRLQKWFPFEVQIGLNGRDRVCESSRDGLLSLVAACQADPKTLTALAA